MTMSDVLDMVDPRNPDRIRLDIKAALMEYANSGAPVGGFLENVVANDLVGAASNADIDNLRALAAIACFVYNELPMLCWGSRRVYRAWLGLHRVTRTTEDEGEREKARDELQAAFDESRAGRR